MSTIQSSNGNQYVTPGIGLSTAGYIAGSMASGQLTEWQTREFVAQF